MKSYYAIIPANVRYDNNICPNAKLLYGEITALCNEKGYCWATNDYFSQLYGVSKTSISKWINSLKQQNYIDIEIVKRDGIKEILYRCIRIVKGGIEEKLNTPIEEKLKDINTLINNTNNNKYNSPAPQNNTAKKVIDIFNKITGKSYRYSDSHLKMINARIKEGATFEDIELVIRDRFKRWKDDSEMQQFIRPSTIFRPSHFEEYLQEAIHNPFKTKSEIIAEAVAMSGG